jgi:hypothetical protein
MGTGYGRPVGSRRRLRGPEARRGQRCGFSQGSNQCGGRVPHTILATTTATTFIVGLIPFPSRSETSPGTGQVVHAVILPKSAEEEIAAILETLLNSGVCQIVLEQDRVASAAREHSDGLKHVSQIITSLRIAGGRQHHNTIAGLSLDRHIDIGGAGSGSGQRQCDRTGPPPEVWFRRCRRGPETREGPGWKVSPQTRPPHTERAAVGTRR